MSNQKSTTDTNKQFAGQNGQKDGQPSTHQSDRHQGQHQQDVGQSGQTGKSDKNQTTRPAPDGTSIGNQQGQADRQSPGQR